MNTDRKTIYILSANRLKLDSVMCDNVDDKYILPVIKASQDIELQELIGYKLLNKVYDLIETNSINQDTNVKYKELVDGYIIPYLIMVSLSNLVVPLQYKFRNEGLIQSVDSQMTHSGDSNNKYTQQYYRDKSNAYAVRLKKFLERNESAFPEYRLEGCTNDKSGEYKLGYKINIVL